MNAPLSLPRRTFEELRDFRSDEQRLQDAVEAILAASDRMSALCAAGAPLPSELAMGAAEREHEDAQAELFRLVEDVLCIDPRKLGRALAS